MRVVITDDSGPLRDGMAGLLTEAGVEVVGKGADAEQLMELVESPEPDVAILDIRCRRPTPIRAHGRAEAAPGPPTLGILLLSQSLHRAASL